MRSAYPFTYPAIIWGFQQWLFFPLHQPIITGNLHRSILCRDGSWCETLQNQGCWVKYPQPQILMDKDERHSIMRECMNCSRDRNPSLSSTLWKICDSSAPNISRCEENNLLIIYLMQNDWDIGDVHEMPLKPWAIKIILKNRGERDNRIKIWAAPFKIYNP